MIGASLLAVTLLTASFAMHEVAYAIFRRKTINPSALKEVEVCELL